jgi:hypothetical protein
MEGVAEAGSWAVWMGVFSKSWMKLLVAGGLTGPVATPAQMDARQDKSIHQVYERFVLGLA